MRALFVAILVVLIAHLSFPQNETIWTVYDTPGDLLRMLLGIAVCIGIVMQTFKRPKDSEAYRTWLYVGLVVVPFSLIVAYAVW